MTKIASLAATTLASLLLALSPAQALSNRAWVSGHGTDAAGCGAPASPCRTFQYVHDNIVAAGGEIDVLDPGGYGPIVITKALSIVNDGVGAAGVQQSVSGQDAILINAGNNDQVFLKGLEIEGLGTGKSGVELDAGGSLTMINCTVKSFNSDGIFVAPTVNVIVSISNTVLLGNGGAGLHIYPQGSAIVQGTISYIEAKNNFYGIELDGSNSTSVGNVLAANDVNASNNYTGFYATGYPSGNVTLTLTRSIGMGNGYSGAYVGTNAVIGSFGDNRFWAIRSSIFTEL